MPVTGVLTTENKVEPLPIDFNHNKYIFYYKIGEKMVA